MTNFENFLIDLQKQLPDCEFRFNTETISDTLHFGLQIYLDGYNIKGLYSKSLDKLIEFTYSEMEDIKNSRIDINKMYGELLDIDPYFKIVIFGVEQEYAMVRAIMDFKTYELQVKKKAVFSNTVRFIHDKYKHRKNDLPVL